MTHMAAPDVTTLSVSQLKQMIESNGLQHGDCFEKHDLVQRAEQAASKAAMEAEILPLRDLIRSAGMCDRDCNALEAVSYTHLTLPTKRIVEVSVVAGSLRKKKGRVGE
eukprot:TRINITY_DN38650_c0_g1_i3.p1 TRINITY_DN38650_c0_g1~~TRINITY_DN38650_c0_g1_i3.p1  ORF type:complete len:109 (-),score=27.78 TRINITY_DN38650_c0_g1_i3:46-372(-)